MGQSWNGPAVRIAARLVASPRSAASICSPHLRVKDIAAVDFAALRAAGAEAVVFDKDNCLTAPYALAIHPPLQDAWSECTRVFPGRILIVSNSAGTPDDRGGEEAAAIEASLQVPVVRHSDKKPEGFADFQVAIAAIDPMIDTTKVIMIGDRILTDVVFGNLNGMFTIHTEPFALRNDNALAAMFRSVEGAFMQWNRAPYHRLAAAKESFTRDTTASS